MLLESEINYYQNNINLKEVIETQNLQTLDEALFVCDLDKVKENYELWQKCLPRVKPYYAVKCNNDTNIIKTLAKLGTGFDCASKNEIKQVLELGVEPERIIFAHSCKPVSHVEFAKEANVKITTVDSEFELYKIHKYYPESNLVIRFRCDAKQADYPMGAKFGSNAEREAPALFLLAKKLKLNVIGTSFHVGSGCNELEVYDRAITTAKQLFDFGSSLGYELNLVDIGGGFPGRDVKKFEKIAEIINKSLTRHFPDNNINIISEPGAFFVTSAGTIICKIHAKREEISANGELLKKMYYVNTGAYGSFCCSLFNYDHITAEHFLDDEQENLPKFKTLIWGPTCDGTDKIVDNLLLPDLEIGDFLAFPNMGAYSLVLVTSFNGFMPPKVLYFKKSTNIKNGK